MFLLCFGLASPTSSQAQFRQLTYRDSQEDFLNPERVFCIPISTSSARFIPLDVETLKTYRTQTQRVPTATYFIYCWLEYRRYRLETFKESPLSDDFIEKIRADQWHGRDP